MTNKDRDYFQQVKERVKQEDSPEIRKLGYHVSPGIGLLEDKLAIIVNLSPLEKSSHPLGADLMEKIKQDLTDKYQVSFDVRYVPDIRAYKKE